jgi:hypothetical protein
MTDQASCQSHAGLRTLARSPPRASWLAAKQKPPRASSVEAALPTEIGTRTQSREPALTGSARQETGKRVMPAIVKCCREHW